MRRFLLVETYGTDKHCSNDCPGMDLDAKFCVIFKEPLKWDPKRDYNGNFRVEACKKEMIKR